MAIRRGYMACPYKYTISLHVLHRIVLLKAAHVALILQHTFIPARGLKPVGNLRDRFIIFVIALCSFWIGDLLIGIRPYSDGGMLAAVLVCFVSSLLIICKTIALCYGLADQGAARIAREGIPARGMLLVLVHGCDIHAAQLWPATTYGSSGRSKGICAHLDRFGLYIYGKLNSFIEYSIDDMNGAGLDAGLVVQHGIVATICVEAVGACLISDDAPGKFVTLKDHDHDTSLALAAMTGTAIYLHALRAGRYCCHQA